MLFLEQMTKKRKMACAGSGVLFLIFLLVGIGWWGFYTVSEKATAVRNLTEGNVYLQMILRGISESLITEGTPASMKIIEEGMTGFDAVDRILVSKKGDISSESREKITKSWKNVRNEIMPLLQLQEGKIGINNSESLVKAGKITRMTAPLLKDMQGAVELANKSYELVSRKVMVLALAGVVLITVIAAFAIMTFLSFSRSIMSISDELATSSGQVTSASAEIAVASQSLAEGASSQAVALEKTVSSIEEMASMTRQSADNANQAKMLMSEMRQVVDEANGSMMDLTQSMREISAASEETAKIIKTIDEIAFQTNLLALNAAVEAARAGEAGAGFAVVASEVRNLAVRAAGAARNTANLIEGTINKIKNGSDIVSRTNGAFGKVASGSHKVSELVGEISTASSEQAQGIEQISKAVCEMDKVVQNNAASAKESASVSEDMNTEAEQMKSFVAQLISLVGRGRTDYGNKFPEGGKPEDRQADQALPLEKPFPVPLGSP